MPDSPSTAIPFGPAAELDPQILGFVQRMSADAAMHPRRDSVPIAQGREIAEQVRRPWTLGGPVMASTVERQVPTRHGEVRIRIHTPAQRKTRGAMLYIHGGGFVLFSVDTHDRVMREYAGRAGMTVIGIDYSRAPEAVFPQPLDECVDTLAWLIAHADELDIDAQTLFIGGDSAGANLSVGTCLARRDAGATPLCGMVLNYGGFTTNLYRHSTIRYGAGDYGLSLHMMAWFYRLYLGEATSSPDPRMELLSAPLAGLPPALLVIAECDPLRDDSVAMAARLRAAGVEVDDHIYPGTVHSFLEAVSVAEVAGLAFDDTVRWLARHGHF